MGKKLSIAAVAAAVLFVGCSEAPKPPVEQKAEAKKEPPKPSGPVTAKTAFYEMYKPARAWAADFLLLTMTSSEAPGVPGEGGKFPVWSAVLVSPSRREARTFTYATADSGTTIHKGVDANPAQVWSGATPTARPFQIGEIETDSDAAYNVAYEKAAAWVKKHPGKKPVFTLGNASRFPSPVWYILWGTKTNGYGIFVNAMTGTPLKGK